MKRIVLPFCLFAAVLIGVSLCMAQVPSGQPQPTVRSSPTSRWQELGTITSAQTYPLVGDRNRTDVAALADAKTVVWDLDSNARNFMLRFQTTADNDSTTISMLGFAEAYKYNLYNRQIDDDALFCASIVLTGGKQVASHSNFYVDTAVVTDGVLTLIASDSGNDRICVVSGNTKGLKRLVFIATTLQTDSTLYVEGRCYY